MDNLKRYNEISLYVESIKKRGMLEAEGAIYQPGRRAYMNTADWIWKGNEHAANTWICFVITSQKKLRSRLQLIQSTGCISTEKWSSSKVD